ncbi:MAG: NAD-dependent epimerase/dehydratase family protein [Bacteroidota bacterium]
MVENINILIIGGDSFVAKSFIAYHRNNYNIKLISRSETNYQNEIILNDFFEIPIDAFKDIDIVINCAAIVHQPKETSNDLYNKINCELAVLNAKKAKENGVKTFIQLSTIAVYGSTENISDLSIENPNNLYGSSKLKADKILFTLSDEAFNTIILRPSMLYGGGNAPGNMMKLIGFADKSIPLPFKNANNKRFFLNIHNLIGFIEASILYKQSNIFVLCDNESISTKELISQISKSLKKADKQISIPQSLLSILKKIKPDIFNKLYGELTIDNTRATEILGFNPTHNIEQGIIEMTKYYLDNKNKKT